MTLCVPPGADWTCAYSAEQLAVMRAHSDTAAKMERSEALAWISLHRLSGGRIGVCPITVRPCAASYSAAGTWTAAPAGGIGPFYPGSTSWSPYINAQGAWVNGCGCTSGCGCGPALSEVILPGPVGRIVEVWLNGAVVNPSRYRVDNGNRLVATDPDLTWPASQNLMQDAHGTEAFSVTYYQGTPPTDVTLWAAGLLAVEFYKACTSDKSCRLPSGVRSITRQGVSYEIRTDMFEDGKTGIREVDTLISALNPYGLRSRPVVYSPDRARAMRSL